MGNLGDCLMLCVWLEREAITWANFATRDERVEMLKHGDVMRVIGRIDDIGAHTVRLGDCELK
jgi:hypothetical protein